jgi:hypothetical protein
MLDAYIIDAIRQAELDREAEFERRRVRLELPLPIPREIPRRAPEIEDERGPIVIPLNPGRDFEDNAA